MYGKDKNKNRSAVGLISLMDPVVSDQSDLEFWLHLIWRMGIWGCYILSHKEGRGTSREPRTGTGPGTG